MQILKLQLTQWRDPWRLQVGQRQLASMISNNSISHNGDRVISGHYFDKAKRPLKEFAIQNEQYGLLTAVQRLFSHRLTSSWSAMFVFSGRTAHAKQAPQSPEEQVSHLGPERPQKHTDPQTSDLSVAAKKAISSLLKFYYIISFSTDSIDKMVHRP